MVPSLSLISRPYLSTSAPRGSKLQHCSNSALSTYPTSHTTSTNNETTYLDMSEDEEEYTSTEHGNESVLNIFETSVSPKNYNGCEIRTSPSRTISSGAIPTKGQKIPAMASCSMDYLREQGYTKGLIRALEKNRRQFPLRVWIVDNSSSMNKRDGHMIADPTNCRYSSSGSNRRNTGSNVQFVQCSRWEEMQQTVDYHAQMAAIIKSTTIFKLLNASSSGVSQEFSIAKPASSSLVKSDERGQSNLPPGVKVFPVSSNCSPNGTNMYDLYHDLEKAQLTMKTTHPLGHTPLNQCLVEVRDNIIQLVPKLKEAGPKKRVAIIIATDGRPTDANGRATVAATQEFSHTLLSLRQLPVWVVVRLCTDEESVVQYWNNFDNNLKLEQDKNNEPSSSLVSFELEVIDDFVSEAREVFEHNKWLNYGLPLHRMREMGFHDEVMDVLDERKLSKRELYRFLSILFGSSIMKKAPQITDENDTSQFVVDRQRIESEWNAFCDYVNDHAMKETFQWNPITQKSEPWINVKHLKRMYQHQPRPNNGNCSTSMLQRLFAPMSPRRVLRRALPSPIVPTNAKTVKIASLSAPPPLEDSCSNELIDERDTTQKTPTSRH